MKLCKPTAISARHSAASLSIDRLVWVQLAEDLPGVSLAFSLHAPNQALRQSIVPSAKAYPLPKLMAALDAFLDSSRQKDAKVSVTSSPWSSTTMTPFIVPALLFSMPCFCFAASGAGGKASSSFAYKLDAAQERPVLNQFAHAHSLACKDGHDHELLLPMHWNVNVRCGRFLSSM